jgi:hypothetical protein
MKQIVIRVMLGLCLGVAPALAFDAYDAKPIAALELMNEEELAYEASQACSGVLVGRIETQLGHPDPYRIARQYLNTVGLVARKNNNEDTPQWYTDTLEASLGDSPEACSRPFARQSQIKHEQEMQKIQRYKEEMNRQIKQARKPPPVAVPAIEAQLGNAEREFRAGRMSLDEFRGIKKVLQGE